MFQYSFTLDEVISRWPNIRWLILLGGIANGFLLVVLEQNILPLPGNLDLNTMISHPFWVTPPAYFDWLNEAVFQYDDRVLRNWIWFGFMQYEVKKLLNNTL